jgi:hypothetical protein
VGAMIHRRRLCNVKLQLSDNEWTPPRQVSKFSLITICAATQSAK